MRILLLSMPDSFEHMPSIVIRMPNGALSSLAGNIDEHHKVEVADLILCQRSVRETVTRLLDELNPQVVGLSVMTFQRRTAERIIRMVRRLKPEAKIAVGGYDPSLAAEAYLAMPIDFIVRGEGEVTFRELTRALESHSDMHFIGGLSHRHEGRWVHNQLRAPSRLESEEIRLPKRSARVLKGYTMLGRQVDVGGGRVHVVVAHERLHHRQVHAGLGESGAEAVTERVRVPGGNTGALAVIAKDASQPLVGEGLAAVRSLRHHEKSRFARLGTFGEQVGLHQPCDVGVNGYPAFLVALSDHTCPTATDVDVSDPESEHFGTA